jgi:hypothetical protein
MDPPLLLFLDQYIQVHRMEIMLAPQQHSSTSVAVKFSEWTQELWLCRYCGGLLPVKGQPTDEPCPSIKEKGPGTIEQFTCKPERNTKDEKNQNKSGDHKK